MVVDLHVAFHYFVFFAILLAMSDISDTKPLARLFSLFSLQATYVCSTISVNGTGFQAPSDLTKVYF